MNRPDSALPRAGDPIDLAPFGRRRCWIGVSPREIRAFPWKAGEAPGTELQGKRDDPPHLGIEWDEPRDIVAVAVLCADPEAFLSARPYVEYWQHAWPWPARDSVRGAHRGWYGRDDPLHGVWRRVVAGIERNGKGGILFRFARLDLVEIPDPRRLEEAEDYLPEFRRTLKIRVCCREDPRVSVHSLAAFAAGSWREGSIALIRPGDGRRPLGPDLRVRIENGHLLSVSGEGDRARFLHTGIAEPTAMSTTLSWEDDQGEGFAVGVEEVLREGGVWIPDFGVLLRPADSTEDPRETVERLTRGRPATIYDRVTEEPEQTLDRAMAETPRLAPAMQAPPVGRYVPLGLEGNRAAFALRFNGNIFLSKGGLRPAGRDTVGLDWPGSDVFIRFGSGDPPDEREREGACVQRWPDPAVPVLETAWMDRGVEYRQTCFAAPLEGTFPDLPAARGDEPIVLHLRFDLRRAAPDAGPASVRVRIDPPEKMRFRNGALEAVGRYVRRDVRASERYRAQLDAPSIPDEFRWELDPYPDPRIRLWASDPPKGRWTVVAAPREGRRPPAEPTALRYEAELEPGEAVTLFLAVPYRTPAGASTSTSPASRFEERRAEAERFWGGVGRRGMQLRCGEPLVDDFFRAAPVHVLITACRDPGSGRYVVPAATFAYGACGNEACLQIRQLDYRGWHDAAGAYLDGLVRMQGKAEPDGDFGSSEGWLQGVDFYDGEPIRAQFGYNLDHGFILACLAEHYLLTRDRPWLERTAGAIVAACDFVVRERKRTMIEEDGQRSPAWGLLPPGHLEDNPEWRHWFAVNAHAYRGMELSARVLREIGHPEAERIRGEAAAYRADILDAVRQARVASPVVRLPDGTSVPHLPTRTHLRGADWGWFREVAYGPLHLVDGGLLEPDADETTWILRYLEDRAFVDRDLGRPIDPEKEWFSRGGVTIQANLLNNATAYLRRDQIRHAVRVMFNTFALSLYPDVLCFTEHPVVEPGRGTGPYYKTPDECAFLNTLRNLLIHETGDDLWIGRGIPRCWMRKGDRIEVENAATWFGPMSISIGIEPDRSVVRAALPERNPPKRMFLRLRRADGARVGRVTIGGTERDVRILPDGETMELPGGIEPETVITAETGRATGRSRDPAKENLL